VTVVRVNMGGGGTNGRIETFGPFFFHGGGGATKARTVIDNTGTAQGTCVLADSVTWRPSPSAPPVAGGGR
jgi:hypothetical protein